MAFCSKCGNQVPDGVSFCSKCGNPVNANAQGASFQNKVNEFMNTPDTTAAYQKDDINNNMAMAILSYITILVLIPIFAAQNSPYARFHANQGLTLLLLEIAYSFVAGIISWMFFFIFAPIGVIFSTLFGIVSLALLALIIIGIVNAAQGKAKELPLIGKIKLLK